MNLKKTSLYGTATAATLALTLTACGGSSSGGSGAGGAYDKDATVNIGSLYEPQNLDNTAGGGQGVTEALNGNVYEGLFRLTDDGKVDKLLAQDYKVSPDGLTYTFTLRDGVKFHSGKELTSEDVKYSLRKVIAEDSQSARKSNLEVVKDVATPDARTVEVTLSQKSISFIYNLSYVWIINSKAQNLKTTEDGTGPYTLDKWTRGSALSLDRFPGYWGHAAGNKKAVFQDVQAAEGGDHVVDQQRRLVHVRLVGLEGSGLRSLVAQFVDDGLRWLLGVDVGEGDIGALLGEEPYGGGSQSAGSAGDQGDLASEWLAHASLLVDPFQPVATKIVTTLVATILVTIALSNVEWFRREEGAHERQQQVDDRGPCAGLDRPLPAPGQRRRHLRADRDQRQHQSRGDQTPAGRAAPRRSRGVPAGGGCGLGAGARPGVDQPARCL